LPDGYVLGSRPERKLTVEFKADSNWYEEVKVAVLGDDIRRSILDRVREKKGSIRRVLEERMKKGTILEKLGRNFSRWLRRYIMLVDSTLVCLMTSGTLRILLGVTSPFLNTLRI